MTLHPHISSAIELVVEMKESRNVAKALFAYCNNPDVVKHYRENFPWLDEEAEVEE